MGGSDEKDNLVFLTSREHYVAHLLLVKMTEGDNFVRMSRAAHMMMHDKYGNKLKTSKLYEDLKHTFITAISEEKKDRTVYEWTHEVYGTAECSMWDLLEKYPDHGMTVSAIRNVKNGFNKTCKGWRLKTTIINEYHHNTDLTEYDWWNQEYGVVTTSTHKMVKDFNLNIDCLNSVKKGCQKSHSGWFLYNGEAQSDKRSKKIIDVIKWYHVENGDIVCTIDELCESHPHISKNHIARVAKGTRKSHKGWRLSS